MRYIRICQIVAADILLFCVAAKAGGQTGYVFGTVINEQGSPVAGVKVTAKLVDDAPIIRVIRYVETGTDGRFRIDRLSWGEYKIFTKKDSDGYPNSASTFYSNTPAPRIKLSPVSPDASVTINLGPKAGFVKGTITDSVTGAPIDAGVHVWQTFNPNYWLEKSLRSQYLLLIPSNVQVGMEVQAKGYEPWYYPGSAAPGRPLIEAPGQAIIVDVRLTPIRKQP